MKDFLEFLTAHLIRGWLFKKAIVYWKKKSLLFYVRTLEKLRRSLMAVVILFFCLQLMSMGFVIAFVSGAYLLPLEPEQKVWIIFGVGSSLFLIPAAILTYALSSRVWLEKSGAQDLLNKN